ncbi:AraC family transcriptional regulator [Winogradskya consettensis]|uniref:AraC family transcriptional regulator n=1 Tax=Winogradskya consettensis TaxID=113560 RepID=A0A919SEJ0_9ACTN|nr:AraC family transcriptional regulator [Actinoplanes consettensis]GIM69608.1 AraC family transcriptional regulator [Actinoplanes consettensis]
MDLLQDHLTRARASGGVFARTAATPPWGLRLAGTIQLSVHTVVQGRAWLWFDDPATALELAPGDLALVRGGRAHHIAHEPGADCLDPGEFTARHAHASPEPGRRLSVFLCGAYRFSGDIGQGLLDALPEVIPLSAGVGDPLHDIIAVLSRELSTDEPGRQTILDRLLDVLLVLALRTGLTQSPDAPRWFRASADPRLSPALRAVHDNAAHPWTVPELAALSGLSRAAFARIFTQALDQTPMQYLTDWRMALARDHLRTSDLTLAQIAELTGYGSPYAFATAFNRHHQRAPGAWRREELDRVAARPDITDAVHIF